MSRVRPTLSLLFLAFLSLLLAACEPQRATAPGAELDDAEFRRGQQLVRQGRNTDALGVFQGIIAKRGGAAPESHLETGLLYHLHLKDPVAAIYHFKKYLELQPNSRQAPLVRQRIDAARRDFARQLPGSPMESQTERLELLDQIDRLSRENDQLRAELGTQRGTYGRQSFLPAENLAASGLTPAPAPVDDPALGLISPAPLEAGQGTAGEEFASDAPALPALPPAGGRQVPTRPGAVTTPATGRLHVVVRGDTLYSLAARYYNDRARWRDLHAANRDQLPTPDSPLSIGMKLRIP